MKHFEDAEVGDTLCSTLRLVEERPL